MDEDEDEEIDRNANNRMFAKKKSSEKVALIAEAASSSDNVAMDSVVSENTNKNDKNDNKNGGIPSKSSETSIKGVSFSDNVTVLEPIRTFRSLKRSYTTEMLSSAASSSSSSSSSSSNNNNINNNNPISNSNNNSNINSPVSFASSSSNLLAGSSTFGWNSAASNVVAPIQYTSSFTYVKDPNNNNATATTTTAATTAAAAATATGTGMGTATVIPNVHENINNVISSKSSSSGSSSNGDVSTAQIQAASLVGVAASVTDRGSSPVLLSSSLLHSIHNNNSNHNNNHNNNNNNNHDTNNNHINIINNVLNVPHETSPATSSPVFGAGNLSASSSFHFGSSSSDPHGKKSASKPFSFITGATHDKYHTHIYHHHHHHHHNSKQKLSSLSRFQAMSHHPNAVGLTTSEATAKLRAAILTAAEILEGKMEYKLDVQSLIRLHVAKKPPQISETFVALVCVLMLIISVSVAPTARVAVEIVFFVFVLSWAVLLEFRGAYLLQYEPIARLKEIAKKCDSTAVMAEMTLLSSRRTSAIARYRVSRDGNWCLLPPNMLVEDDIISLAAGEAAPARIRCLTKKDTLTSIHDDDSHSHSHTQSQSHSHSLPHMHPYSPAISDTSETESNSVSSFNLDNIYSKSPIINPMLFLTASTAAIPARDSLILDIGQIYQGQKDVAKEFDVTEILGYTHNSQASKADSDELDNLPPFPEPTLFVVLETPFTKQAVECITNLRKKRPDSPFFQNLYLNTRKKLHWILWVVLFFAIIINFCRFFTTKGGDWTDFLMQRIPYNLLPLMPLTGPLLFFFMRALGNARLLALFELIEKTKLTLSRPAPSTNNNDSNNNNKNNNNNNTNNNNNINDNNNSNSNNIGGLTLNNNINNNNNNNNNDIASDDSESDVSSTDESFRSDIPVSLDITSDRLFHHFKTLIRGECWSFSRNSSPLDTLGSTTVWCCMDRRGLLSYPNPFVTKVFLPRFGDEPITLDLHHDLHKPANCIFYDSNWQQYITSLRPLGFGALIQDLCGKWLHEPLRSAARHYHRYVAFKHCNLFHSPPMQGQDACLCSLYRVIGFHSDDARIFKRRKEIHCFSSFCVDAILHIHERKNQNPLNFPVPCMYSLIVQDGRTQLHQLFSRGTPDLVLANCTHYFDGTTIHPMDVFTRRKYFDQARLLSVRGDCTVVAMSYKQLPADVEMTEKPILLHYDTIDVNLFQKDHVGVSDSNNNDDSDKMKKSKKKLPNSSGLKTLLNGQIFIGLVSLSYQPKPEVRSLLQEMSTAGVRFVLFNKQDELKTLSFGEKLGLEIDWNCCINLDDNAPAVGLIESDIKSKMPRGVSTIRDHLNSVDNIPLLVQLFAGSTVKNALEMIWIHQENHNVVCSMGSSMAPQNMKIFACSNIAFGIQPEAPRRCLFREYTEDVSPPPYSLTAMMSSLPCYLQLPVDTDVSDLMEILRECRHILNNMRQALTFMVAAHLCLAVMMLFGSASFEYPIFNGIELIWLMWLIIPLLCLSYMSSPHDPDIMRVISDINTGEISDYYRFSIYFCLRFLPTVAILLWIYSVSLQFVTAESSNDLTDEDVTQAQCIMLFFLVYYLAIFQSMSFVHRTKSIVQFNPFSNKHWVLTAIFCIIAQIIFSAVGIIIAKQPIDLTKLPTSFIVVAFCWPIVIVIVDELVKRHDRIEYARFQKRLRLIYDTKLGMHSPK